MNGENIEDIYELSPMQHGLLFHTLAAPNSGVYFEQLSCTLQGNLDVAAFKSAWQKVVERHPILRTAFYWQDLDRPYQVVYRQVDLPIAQQDWRELSAIEQQERLEFFLQSDRDRGFELSQAPLMRLALIRLADDTYQFVRSHHHILLDGWSWSLLWKEVHAFYQAFSQNRDLNLEQPRPYREYIAWLQEQDFSKTEIFWRQKLKGFAAPTPLMTEGAGTGAPPLQPKVGEDDKQRISLSATATVALQSLARQHQLTLNAVVQGAWALLLSRYSGEEDVVFGVATSGRPAELAGVESMVGLFLNALPLRVQVLPDFSVVPWLKQLQSQQVEARQYEYSTLVQIHQVSEIPSGQPLFESILVFNNYPMDASKWQLSASIGASNYQTYEKTNYPLTVLVEPGSQLKLEIAYDTRRFDAAAIARMLGHFQTLLEGMAANQNQRLALISLLTAAELHQQLVEWNNTHKDYPKDKCIHQLFEEQVEKSPDATAVIFEDTHLSYKELNRRSNQLAHRLRKLGVGPDVLVGICVERSLSMLVAVLGVLKAGGAYVPLDPAYPQERLAFMLEDAQVKVLLTQKQLAEFTNLTEILPLAIVYLDADWETIACENDFNSISETNSSHLAYTIYTSGSTGKPKGVQIRHRAVVNFLTSMRHSLEVTERDILLSVTTLSFDIAALELFLPIITGASTVVASREVAASGTLLAEQLVKSGATFMQATPATWQMLHDAGWQGNKQLKILCGGEALSPKLAGQLYQKGSALWNLYGPTETTIWSMIQPIDSEDKPISIGRAIANTQVYILDRHLQPVPIGVAGELHIGGDGLARGYLNRPDLTAEKFIPNPLIDSKGSPCRGGAPVPAPVSVLYKTGDLVRYRPDGNIEYLGRLDHQVKIRGFRIELAEIEAVLNQHPGVSAIAVLAREDEAGNKRLVAYIVPDYKRPPTVTELRNFLKQKLPEYTIPSAFVMLSTLPLTPNGKVDRRALPAPDTARPELEKAFVAPRTPVEEVLAAIWLDILGLDQLGIYDSFFELGGHSLLATQVISRLRSAFQVDVAMRWLFESPTVASLSDRIEVALKAKAGLKILPIERVSRDRHLPLSFAQQRLWFLDQLEPNSAAYNIPAAVRIAGNLSVAVLLQSLNEIVQRHEILRTTFTAIDGKPIAIIAPTLTLKLPVLDLQHLPETQRNAEVLRLAEVEAQQPFDLAQGPLLRATLLKLSEAEYVVLFAMHHIISDGWSAGVLLREIATLYEAFSNNKPSPLPELPIQYADFADWQHRWLQGEVLQTQLSYWQQQLAGAPPVLNLKTIATKLPNLPEKNTGDSFLLPTKLSEKLKALSRQEEVTLFMTLLAAFQTLLYRYTNQDDIVVGTDVANRNRAETEPLIGFFVNLLVLRTSLSGNPSFRELLRRVRQVALDAYAHQDLPFAKLVEAVRPDRSASTTPLFQVLFVLQNTPMPAWEFSDLTLTPLEFDTGKAKFDLVLFMEETKQGVVAKWKYNPEIFSSQAIAHLSNNLEALLNSIVGQPDAGIDTLEIPMNTEKEKQLAETVKREETKFKKFIQAKPKATSLPQGQLIKTDYLNPGQTFPLVIQPDVPELDLADWAKNERELIETKLLKHGAILFRGFHIKSVVDFENLALAICPELFSEYGDLPRQVASGKVYGSTPYPSDRAILFHNESSHLHRWPLKIWFFCVQPAQAGGETPIVDCRQMYQLLDPKLRERFEQKQLMYVRNYTEGLDVSWQEFFRTNDKKEVEDYCRQADIDFEWREDNSLKTRKVRAAIAKHPKTGEWVFFNQLQLHHISCLDLDSRQSMLSVFGEQNLPRNVYYGDGSPIENSVMEEVGAVYEKAKISFPWQQGDVLMLDNMLAAHGRNPYAGDRKILVAMGEMICSQNI
ncbi:amino acid adenylation domain-containing protein [Microcoleus sp. F10-C6]|uniref:amino acid adenylation domain-containing protein n=1 Tax=unclassified Microcoleus TaxID=2642155 RepID=UPI002FCF0666